MHKKHMSKLKRIISGLLALTMTASASTAVMASADSDIVSNENYSILAGKVKLNGTHVNVNGDIHSNDSLEFGGYQVKVSGCCYYTDEIRNYCGELSYLSGACTDTQIEMPQVSDGLYYLAGLTGANEYHDGIVFSWQEELELTSTISYDYLNAYGRNIWTQDIIASKNNLSFNSTNLTSPQNRESFIYSAEGDISIQANIVDLDGLIYAPNGKVLINATNIDFSGVIIAEEVEINGNDVNISACESNAYLLELASNIYGEREIIAVGDFDSESSVVDLAWRSNMIGDAFSVWASYDGTDYAKVTDLNDFSYAYYVENGHNSVDIYIEQELLSGTKLVSNIVSLIADENGNYTVIMYDSDEDGLVDPLEKILGTNINEPDTDGDGLTDYEEVYYTHTDPLEYDSDQNDICDADEDPDDDGLSFREELDLGTDLFEEDTDGDHLNDGDEVKTYFTDPLEKDTDGDDFSDGYEVKYYRDPLNPDSDGDGISDGDDIYTVTKSSKESDSKVSVELTIDIPGRSVDSLSIDEVPDDDLFLPSEMPGFIGNGFDFYVDCEFDTATMKYTFDESLLDTPDFEPAVYYCDIVNQKMVLLDDQVYDPETCTVTATTTHFSRYILLNKTKFEEIWDKDFETVAVDENGHNIAMDIALVIDSSGSMSWNDPDDLRKDAAKEFIDKLGSDDEAAIIDFDYYSYTYQTLTGENTLLYNAINMIDSSGGTSLTAGVSAGLDALSKSNDKKIMILLTDGVGAYDKTLTTKAISAGVTIYTIGLGYDIDQSLLQSIATDTGGKYYHAEKDINIQDGFDGVGEDIGNKDSDGDNLPDEVEKNLYWFNGVSLAKAAREHKPSDIDLYLGFDPDNKNTFYESLSDGDIVVEYKQINENRYEAKLLDGVIWDIPNFNDKRVENFREDVCDQLENLLASNNIDSAIYGDNVAHHILAYHSDAGVYKCEYCDYTVVDPKIEDKDILSNESQYIIYTLDAFERYDENKTDDQMFNAIKTALRVKENDVNGYSYSTYDNFDHYIDPKLCVAGYNDRDMNNNSLSISISEITMTKALMSSNIKYLLEIDFDATAQEMKPLLKKYVEQMLACLTTYAAGQSYEVAEGIEKKASQLTQYIIAEIEATLFNNVTDENQGKLSLNVLDFLPTQEQLRDYVEDIIKMAMLDAATGGYGTFVEAFFINLEYTKDFICTELDHLYENAENYVQHATLLPGNYEVNLTYTTERSGKYTLYSFISQIANLSEIHFIDNKSKIIEYEKTSSYIEQYFNSDSFNVRSIHGISEPNNFKVKVNDSMIYGDNATNGIINRLSNFICLDNIVRSNFEF